MQQFVIPQFIDVEDKIIGPITTRQFMIMIGGGLSIAVAYRLFDLKWFAIISVIILAIVIVFSFVKINGRPFHYFLVNMIETLKKPNLRVWDKVLSRSDLKIKAKKEGEKDGGGPGSYTRKPLVKSRLTELSLIIDTGGVYQPDEDLTPKKSPAVKNKKQQKKI